MKEKGSGIKIARDVGLLLLSTFLFIGNFIPIAGPSIVSYAIGNSKRRNSHYGFNDKNVLISLLIAEIAWFVLAFFITNHVIYGPGQKTLLLIFGAGLVVNLMVVFFSYFMGVKSTKITV